MLNTTTFMKLLALTPGPVLAICAAERVQLRLSRCVPILHCKNHHAHRHRPHLTATIRAFTDTPTNSTPTNNNPTNEINHVQLVKDQLASKNRRILIAQIAPAVRVSIGEDLGLPPGTIATGKLVSALRLLGFDYVFDVLSAADCTIVEEAAELIHRLATGGGVLPMFTSCCPGWIQFVEQCAPELIPHVSTAKSPHMMGGALIKAYFSSDIGTSESDVSVVSIMPCVRKQGEADRVMYQTRSGARQVDHVLTTKDVGKLIIDAGIDFQALPDAHFDDFLGIGSGGSALFGSTGGVAEAALRTVVDLAGGGGGGGTPLKKLVYEDVRGLDGVKEAFVEVPANPTGPLHNDAPVQLHVAVANGLGNAKKLLKIIADGKITPFHFVEVMACPGGCIGGGGQPRSKDKNILQQRQQALYAIDEQSAIRKSHENPVVKQIYSRYLGGEPFSEKARELLHTTYVECGPGKFDLNAPPPPPNACDLVEVEECDDENPLCLVENFEFSSCEDCF